jgi:hypothetical protein
MEEMASRPFSSITVEIERKYEQIGAEKKELDLRKRKKVFWESKENVVIQIVRGQRF